MTPRVPHPEWQQLRDQDEEDPQEVEARKYDLNYIQLDAISLPGERRGPCDGDHGHHQALWRQSRQLSRRRRRRHHEKVTEAFKIMLRIPHLKGDPRQHLRGIMKCDVIAAGVVAAAKQVSLRVPLVVRLEGTTSIWARKILAESGCRSFPAATWLTRRRRSSQRRRGRTDVHPESTRTPG